MRIRFALLALIAALASAAIAPAAQATTRKLVVTPFVGIDGFCRAATDQVMVSYKFKAKIKRKNSPLPKKVMVKYSVADAATGQVMVAQKLALRPRSFLKVGRLVQYTAGQQIQISLDVSFKSPLTGRTLRRRDGFSDAIPTVEQLDAASPPVPGCAAG